MESMQAIREVMAWITALNLGILLFSTAVLAVAGAPIKRLHARMFDLSEGDLSRAYFQYLAQYKIAFLVFNLVPYLALHIVG
ncbi:MAG: hypothetical protein JRE43_03805 [Deltaproteobacteria bacterium]|jgi:hypothetical protein|nr:hypothetical protein [Deltaproteobacteria bacterium]